MAGKKTELISKLFVKLACAPLALARRGLGVPLLPQRVVFMATDRCNSRCLHCNIWQKKDYAHQMSPEEIERFFSDKLFRNVRYVICTGGEPTVREDIAEVFIALHRALPKAVLQLSTNAIVPERALAVVEASLKHGFDLEVGVSLDDVGAGHDRIRGIPGNFERAQGLLKELVRLKQANKSLKLAAGIVISDLTVDSLRRVREYCCGLGVPLVEAWYNMSDFYGNCAQATKQKMTERIRDAVHSQEITPLQRRWLKWLEGKPIRFPCFAVNTFCVVKCNGDIAPCLTKWDETIGNAREVPAHAVWRSKQAGKVRKSVKQCQGCLNTWGAGWSFEDSAYPLLGFIACHPGAALKKLFPSP